MKNEKVLTARNINTLINKMTALLPRCDEELVKPNFEKAIALLTEASDDQFAFDRVYKRKAVIAKRIAKEKAKAEAKAKRQAKRKPQAKAKPKAKK